MQEQIYTGGLERMPLDELRSLLKQLEADEKRILKLKKENPKIAKLKSDDGLKKEEYDIFQSLSALYSIQIRIKNIKKLLK